MLKKLITTICTVSFISILLFLGYSILDRVEHKKQAYNKIQNIPSAKLFGLDSLPYTLPNASRLCLIYFDSGCDHCQYELRSISKNISSFKNTNIVFFSTENIDIIKKIPASYGFSGIQNIVFVKINNEDVYNEFGQLSLPHIFIYGKDSKLIKEFKGETKVQAILKYIP
jgi:thioredoxin-related protein